MRKKVRKSLAFLLALALVVSVMSGLGLSVSADDAQNEPVVTETEGEPAEEKLKAEESTPKEGEEEEEADPDAEAVPEEKKDEQKAEGEGSGDESPVKDTTADPNGEQKDESQAKPAAEEPAEPEEEPAASYLSTLSVEELYAYLTKLDDNNFAAAWKELTDSQKAEYNAYVLKMTFGDNKTTTSYEGGGAAASMTNVAGLVSNLAASQKALRNSPARAARAAVQAAADVTLSDTAKDPVNGLYMNKWITKKDSTTDGTDYTIHLESYTTGKTTTTYSSKPCDIVLVLDQSGSMAWSFKKVTYTEKKFEDTALNSEAYKHKDSLYVKGPDGTHIKVSVTRENDGTYVGWSDESNYGWDWSRKGNIKNYYYKTKTGEYKQMISVNWKSGLTYTYTYTYNGGFFYSCNYITLYTQTTQTKYKYTYSYTYNDETKTTTITGKDNATVVPSKTSNSGFFVNGIEQQLYYAEKSTNDDYTRLDGLKDAVNQFVSSVESDATTSGVDHNIAIVGFGATPGEKGYNQNTEVLTGVNIKNKNGVLYNTKSRDYQDAVKNALQDIKTAPGRMSIKNAIDALDANGATRTDCGVAMAKDIFDAKTISDPDRYKDNKRNKVVVIFTDGSPTSSSDFESRVANRAISNAKDLKTGGVTVYSIGIFNDANVNGTSNENKFMNYVSSNYPQATEMTNPGTAADKKGYYLTAADSAALNEIFSKIASEIGSSDVALNTTTQTIDKMSAEFKLPEGITTNQVEVYEVPCTSVNADGSYTFGDKTKLKDAVVSINKDAGTVSVSGFDYSKKYINKDSTANIKGYKLLIEFPVEYKNDAWFGGNDIESNDIGSGIYNGGSCYGTFEVPKVNRAIDYKIEAKDQTIYVTNKADLKELLDYPQKDADRTYQPNGTNNRYVDITYTLKQGDTEIGTYKINHAESAGTWIPAEGQDWNPALEDCTEYTWTCTVTPNKSDGKSLGVAGTGHDAAEETKFDGDKAKKGTVHVLYPTVKAADKFIYWGESVTPADQITVEQNWTELHSNHNADTPDGTKPTITKEAEFKADEKGNTPSKDSDYNVIAKIGEKDITQLLRDHNRIVPDRKAHESCDDTTGVTGTTTANDFCIHVKVKKLTVEKIVGGNMGDTNQGFTFTGRTIYDDSKNEVKNKFTLKNGQDVTFKLKVGDDVSITEDSVAGYKTSYKVGDVSANSYEYNYGKVTTDRPNEVTVTYTNKKQINPPNGIITTIAPYAIMVVLAAGAGVYFVYSRRRRNH